ncbi:2-oxoacid:acceptor oxidoreductase subunit alpha [Alkalicella caledoniensis]|uniref:2-oxoacid:acceptor oxidoreductase subunit alpha n=1 Tax=Alkalicella caledoniensis TaxID=2731377 RepID=A0A7G9W5F0_ALKCA|nr:2-oxoacid:acceptor oxidoreductase subunit alpha [Alkalicella caledoniensis]QNO13912.1 2-oxoacid:acceptor oxidoreductase subunit alpha [Alkalicella caledoniensis]
MGFFLQGNEACALAGLNGGVKYYAGYPITPSTEIAGHMALKLPKRGGVFIQMEDEIASIAAALGASACGVKSMTATSGPGFSLKQENIGYGIMAEIPLLVVNVQRVGPSTGAPTSPAQGDVMQSRWGTHGDHPMIVFTASSVQQVYEMTIHSLNVAEQLKMPVILLLDETIAHLKESVVLKEIPLVTRQQNRIIGQGDPFHTTGLSHDEFGFPATNNNSKIAELTWRLHKKVEENTEKFTKIEIMGNEDYEILLVGYGISHRSALAAMEELEEQGKKVAVLNLLTLWPLPYKQIQEFSRNAQVVVFIELNLGMISDECKKYIDHKKILSITKTSGQLIEPWEIVKTLSEGGY